DDRPMEGVSRAIFVACLIDARVRARSGMIETEAVALLDYQGDELARDGGALDRDPAVFHAADGAAWITGPADEASTLELEEAFRGMSLTGPPDRFAAIVREMTRRIEPIAAIPTGQDRVYLAPGRGSPRAPANAAEIEAAAMARGFALVHPEELGFAEQVRLLRHARFIVMSEARQVLLSLFAQRGANVLHRRAAYAAELP